MDKHIELKPLSPNTELYINDNDNYKIYKKILDDSLGNQKKQVKNIAITGKYGSGKSSLIDSYFDNDDLKDRYLKVTAATFIEGETTKEKPSTKDLMANIINQIIYQINPHRIPLTKFKIKVPLSKWKRWLYIVEILCLLALFTGQNVKLPFIDTKFKLGFQATQASVHISSLMGGVNILLCILLVFIQLFWIWEVYKRDAIKLSKNEGIYSVSTLLIFSVALTAFYMYKFIGFKLQTNATGLLINDIDMVPYLREIICIVIIIQIMWKIFSVFDPTKFKLAFRNIETEIDLSRDDLFEKHIDEIIYLFKQSGKDILIVEDLDRFNNIEIFEKFRELNIKLNNASKTQWQFIYLLKDDIFTDRYKRSKFFDLIVPVLPFLTTNNSFDTLYQVFPNHSIELLNILSLYVDDYRLMLNISNEYTVFANNIKENNKDQLLALITYKNVYPDKFDDLQNGKGELADIFAALADVKKQQKKELTEEIETLRAEKEKQIANDEKFLLLQFAYHNNLYYTENSNGYAQSLINYINITEKIILNDYYVGNSNDIQLYSQFKSENEEYALKITALHEYSTVIKRLQDKLKNFDLQKNAILDKIKLTENIRANDTEKYDEAYIVNDFLYIMIKNGYIDEYYLNVINHFYGSNEFKEFLWDLYNENSDSNPMLKLNDIPSLLPRLKEQNFKKEQILNVSLFKYMSENDMYKFQLMVNTALNVKNGFLESVIENDKILYEILKKVASENGISLLLNLEKFTKSDLIDIIENRFYEDTESNNAIAANYLKELDNKTRVSYVNDDRLYERLRISIVRNLDKLAELDIIQDSQFWNYALKYDRIISTSSNLIKYFENFGLDNNLIEYIKNTSIEYEDDAKLPNDLYRKIALNSEIGTPKYKEVIEHCDTTPWDIAEVESLPIDKVQVLFDLDLVIISIEAVKFLNENEVKMSDDSNVKSIASLIVEEKLDINKVLFNQLLKKNVTDIDLIFSRNLVLFNDNEVKAILVKLNMDTRNKDKLLKLIKRVPYASNYKFDDTPVNCNLLNWLKREGYIENFNSDGNGKLAVQGKKTN